MDIVIVCLKEREIIILTGKIDKIWLVQALTWTGKWELHSKWNETGICFYKLDIFMTHKQKHWSENKTIIPFSQLFPFLPIGYNGMCFKKAEQWYTEQWPFVSRIWTQKDKIGRQCLWCLSNNHSSSVLGRSNAFATATNYRMITFWGHAVSGDMSIIVKQIGKLCYYLVN